MTRAHLGHGAEVPRVAHQAQAGDVSAAHGPCPAGRPPASPGPRRGPHGRRRPVEPVPGRVQRLLGQVDRPGADVLVRVEADLLEHGGERRELDLAVAPSSGVPSPTGLVPNVSSTWTVHRRERVGVVVDLDRADVRLLLLPVEPVDVVLRALVEVDGLLVEQDRGGELVHLADDLRARAARCR